jgi:hypothetical protein
VWLNATTHVKTTQYSLPYIAYNLASADKVGACLTWSHSVKTVLTAECVPYSQRHMPRYSISFVML